MMAEEEKHLLLLKKQFQIVNEEGELNLSNMKSNYASNIIINDKLKERIDYSSYEYTAVSVAILLEQNAYKFYQKLLKNSINNDETSVYSWLSSWEKEHLDSLISLDKHIKEKVWSDNQFWPL